MSACIGDTEVSTENDFCGKLAHLLFIRKNVLEVWPQIDVIDRIESRCPLDTWASDSSINNGLGQTPKDVDEEDCPRSLYSIVIQGDWFDCTFLFDTSLLV